MDAYTSNKLSNFYPSSQQNNYGNFYSDKENKENKVSHVENLTENIEI
jgi:hypothetical protein